MVAQPFGERGVRLGFGGEGEERCSSPLGGEGCGYGDGGGGAAALGQGVRRLWMEEVVVTQPSGRRGAAMVMVVEAQQP